MLFENLLMFLCAEFVCHSAVTERSSKRPHLTIPSGSKSPCKCAWTLGVQIEQLRRKCNVKLA